MDRSMAWLADGLTRLIIHGQQYDNEWGYSCRVVDLLKHVAAHDGVKL